MDPFHLLGELPPARGDLRDDPLLFARHAFGQDSPRLSGVREDCSLGPLHPQHELPHELAVALDQRADALPAEHRWILSRRALHACVVL
jgi:hypothetical protein